MLKVLRTLLENLEFSSRIRKNAYMKDIYNRGFNVCCHLYRGLHRDQSLPRLRSQQIKAPLASGCAAAELSASTAQQPETLSLFPLTSDPVVSSYPPLHFQYTRSH